MKLKFKEDQKSPTLDIMIGEYRRQFDAKEQPFAVESGEELGMLLRTGHFEKVEEQAEPAKPKAQSPKSKVSKTADASLPSDEKDIAIV
jgi:hypothetical protein